MIRATMLAACAAVLALVALPALAGAEETNNPGDPYLEGLNPETSHFTLEGNGHPTLTGPAQVTCESLEGTGEFEDQETGWIELTIGGCKGPFGITCTTHEREAGTIATTKLPFHLKTVLHEHNASKEGVGVLITTNEGHLASFTCSAFFNIKVVGNGIVGTITEPGEKKPSNTATFTLETNEAGEQTHGTVTGDETIYDLKTDINGGGAETASVDSHSTLKFHEGEEPEILTTGEEEEETQTIEEEETKTEKEKTEKEKTEEEEETETTNNPGDPYLEGLVNPHFTMSGETVTLTGSATLACGSFTGTGEFEDQEAGWIELTIHDCTGPFGLNCTSPGQETGTVITETLPFHLKTVLNEHTEEKGVGVLITPGAEEVFATFSCSVFYNFKVTGNGLVGTITEPAEQEQSSTATFTLESSELGVQTHTTVTHDTTTYDLKASINGGEAQTISTDAHGTLEFTEGEPEILTTPEE